MKVGLVHFMAYPDTLKGEGPIAETVKKVLLDEYFTAIEITTIKNDEERNRVKKMLKTAHVTVAFGAQPMLLSRGLNVNDLNDKERQKAIALLKKGIDEAYEMGAYGFSFLSGKYKEAKKEDALAALIDSTNMICSYAKEKGNMKVSLEVFDYDVDKKCLIGPANLALRYAQEVRERNDNFGLMIDLSHMPLIRESIEESVMPLKDYISHAHIGNCVIQHCDMPAYGDMHPCFGFPDSENDVEEVTQYMKILLQVGFLNEKNPPVVSFEIKPFEDEDPDLVIANAKRTLNEAWARV